MRRNNLTKTVTIKLADKVYEKVKNHALIDNRPLSNFIETATLKYIDEIEYIGPFEMENILNDADLMKSLKRGHNDALLKKGRFVESAL